MMRFRQTFQTVVDVGYRCFGGVAVLLSSVIFSPRSMFNRVSYVDDPSQPEPTAGLLRVPKNYNGIWAENPGGFGPPSADILSYSHHDSRPDDTVSIIDVASGNGRYAVEFSKMGYEHVTALEISEEGCTVIEQRAHDEGCPELSVRNSDILKDTTLPRYDVVVSSGLLEEFETQEEQVAAVRRLQDITTSGGRIVLRYCLDISNRDPSHRVDEDLVRPLFPDQDWNVIHFETDPAATYNEKSTIDDGQNVIRRQTLVATKKAEEFAL